MLASGRHVAALLVDGGRPLSDMTGLAAALAVQALTPGASTRSGLRPRLPGRVRRGDAIAGGLAHPAAPPRLARGTAASATADASLALRAFIIGGLVWCAAGLTSGGPVAYWHAVFTRAPRTSRASTCCGPPTPREVVSRSTRSSRHGGRRCRRHCPGGGVGRRLAADEGIPVHLALLTAAFAPYLVFDLLFQETITTRYALPLVVPVAYLGVRARGVSAAMAAGIAGCWRLPRFWSA